ncbi:hypothetical protein GGR53DRAFT_462510 [Hypoxylon sp. FL1150]|nr:hypothetical protein GGR53DRAFT_462510 [Hypoxylon sp. FL1150]
MGSGGQRVQWYDGYQSAHSESSQHPGIAADRRRREQDTTDATGNYRHLHPQMFHQGLGVGSRIDGDVPLALIPGSGYGIGRSWDYEHQERPGQELHIWSGVREQSNPGSSFNPHPSASDFTRPGQGESSYVSFPRWESLMRLEDKSYAFPRGSRPGETSGMVAQMQTTPAPTSSTSSANPFADFDGDFTALSRPATPVGLSSYEASDLSDPDVNRPTFTPSPISLSLSDRTSLPGPTNTPVSLGSFEVSDLSDADVDRPTFTPSPVSFVFHPVLGSDDNPSSFAYGKY